MDAFNEPVTSADHTFRAQDSDVNDEEEYLGFSTSAGTRGVNPSGRSGRWLFKLFNNPAVWWIGRPIYRRLMGCDSLVLTTIGRKSGTERRTRVARFPDKNGGWLIVAAAGGTADNPAWYYNLAARPGTVRIDVDRRNVVVVAEQLHGAERAEAWQQIIGTSPQFARFQEQTDRELPVIRLVPQSRF